MWSIISVQFTQRIAQRVHKVNRTPFTIAVSSALKCPTPTLFSYHSMHCVLVHFLLVFSVLDATTTTHDTMQRKNATTHTRNAVNNSHKNEEKLPPTPSALDRRFIHIAVTFRTEADTEWVALCMPDAPSRCCRYNLMGMDRRRRRQWCHRTENEFISIFVSVFFFGMRNASKGTSLSLEIINRQRRIGLRVNLVAAPLRSRLCATLQCPFLFISLCWSYVFGIHC